MTDVAAVDCGTNSVRLLVLDGAGRELVRRTRIVRLGQHVDRTGRLAPDALERARAALDEYAGVLGAYRVGAVRAVATSALRDAANPEAFADVVRSSLGVELEVLSGAEEAELSFSGAARGLPDVHGPLLVADVGGGSTELIYGDPSVRWVDSVDVGSVRLTERHLQHDPPVRHQIHAARDEVQRALADIPWPSGAALVGVAGTVLTLAAVALDLDGPDARAVHGARISAPVLHELAERLLRMSHDQRARIPQIHPGRVDVIAAGALIVDVVMSAAHASELTASIHDLLDGVANTLIARTTGMV